VEKDTMVELCENALKKLAAGKPDNVTAQK
jgi:hypothetical protein